RRPRLDPAAGDGAPFRRPLRPRGDSPLRPGSGALDDAVPAGRDEGMTMDAKAAARERLEAARGGLVDLSHRIHAHPELAFEEERSAAWVAEVLDAAGFRVTRGICDLPTAFAARAGSGPLHIAFCAEYDALPGIGHACGHNLIAAAAVGAAL